MNKTTLHQKSLGNLFSRFSSGKGISSSRIKSVGAYPVLGANGIRGYTDVYNFEGDCTIIGRQGANCGVVSFHTGKAYMTEHAIVAQANSENNSRFLAYKLGTLNLGRLSGQSAQPGLSVITLSNEKIDIPNLEVQQKIAAVLSALDDKIELNRKINAELEQMARTLYDYWFVQFDFPDAHGKPYKSSGGATKTSPQLNRPIPTEWEVLKLQDVLEFEKGTEPGADAYSEIQDDENDMPFYRVGDIDGQTSTFVNSSSIRLKIVKPTDIVVTFDGSVGKMGLGLDGAISGGLRHIYDKTSTISDAGIYAIFNDEYITKTIERYATGSVILHASSSIPYLAVPYDEATFSNFQKVVEPIFAKIIANRQQSQNLANLRDWLLPMLMNGQVRVEGGENEA